MRLYGISEIAGACGATRQQVAQWHHRGTLPTPDAVLASGPVWVDRTIEAWIAQKIAGNIKAVVIGDLAGSRHLPPEAVESMVTKALVAARTVVRETYPHRHVRFEATTGDEWEGLIGTWDRTGVSLTTDLLRAWRHALGAHPFRIGLGLGPFRAPRGATDPRRMTGDPFYAARAAIEKAKTHSVRGAILEYVGGVPSPTIPVSPVLRALMEDAP